MSNGTKAINQRRESRFGIARDKTLCAKVTLLASEEDEISHDCVILDLSRNGSKIRLDQSVPNHARLRLEFNDAEFDIAIAVDSIACWCRPADGESWWIGCSFDEPLSLEVLSNLALAGFIDRRNDPRIAYDVAIRCRRQLNDEELDGTLVNLSVGGFAILLEHPAALVEDERVLVELQDRNGTAVAVLGRVCWCGNEDSANLVGCSFVSRDGYPLLRQSLAALKQSHGKRRCPRPVRAMLGLLAAVAVIAAGATILMRGLPKF